MKIDQSISITAKIKEIGFHSFIYGIGSVSQSAVGLFLLPILTGTLSKEEFGVYSLITMASSIASTVFYLGMETALPRSYYDYELDKDRREVFTTAFVIMFAGAIFEILLTYCYSNNISKFLIGNQEYSYAIFLAFTGGALTIINNYLFGYLRIQRKSVTSVVFSLISFCGSIILTYYFISTSLDVLTAPFKAIIISQACIALLFCLIFGKHTFSWKLNILEIPKLLNFGVAAVIASFGGILMESLDRLLIQQYMNFEDIGTYSASFRVGMLINVVFVLPFSQVWSPMVIEYKKKNNIKDLFTKFFSIYFILGGCIVIAASLFAKEFLPTLIRSEVGDISEIIFLTTLIGLLIFGTTNFVGVGLTYERRIDKLSYIYYFVAFTKAIVGAFLIPFLGLIGASLAAVLGYLCVPLLIYKSSKKYFLFPIEWKRIFLFLLVAFPSLLYGFFGSFHTQISLPIRLLWIVLSLIMVLFICLSSYERKILRSIFK